MEIRSMYEGLKDNDSSCEDDIIAFKLVLSENETIARQWKFIEGEGMIINAIKDNRHVIVSFNKPMVERISSRIEKYKHIGSPKGYQAIERIEPYTAKEKRAPSLNRYIEKQQNEHPIDVQIMLLSHLDEALQTKILTKLKEKIQQINGEIQGQPYQLSNGTAIIRAVVPQSRIDDLANDNAIYRIEQTALFLV